MNTARYIAHWLLFGAALIAVTGCEMLVAPYALVGEASYVACRDCGGDLEIHRLGDAAPQTFKSADVVLAPNQVRRDFAANRLGLESGSFEVDTLPIEPSDVWRVTHRIGEVLLIQSTDYNARLCRYLRGRAAVLAGEQGDGSASQTAPCELDPEQRLGVFIRADGSIVSGWIGLSARYARQGYFERDVLRLVRLVPDSPPIDGWPGTRVFVPVTP